MSAHPQDVWGQFTHDPRYPAYAGLRAGDEDRDVVYRLLGDAYAMGRLSREEHDERTDYVTQARTLGELPSVLTDLVAAPPPPPPPPTWHQPPTLTHRGATPPPPPPVSTAGQAQQLRAAAEKLVRTRIRRQWTGVIVAAVLCLMLSSISGPFSIVLPLVATVLLLGRVVRTQSRRTELVVQEQRQLEWQVADQLQRQQRGH